MPQLYQQVKLILALLQSSEIICWGWDANAQLGDGEAFLNTDSFVPVKVSDTVT